MSTPPGAPPPVGPPIGGPAPSFPASSAYERPVPLRFARPFGVSLLAVLNGIGGLFSLVGAALILVAGIASRGEPGSGGAVVVFVVIGVLYALLGAFQLATAIGLW